MRTLVKGQKLLCSVVRCHIRKTGFILGSNMSSTAEPELVKTETLGHVHLIGINRPEKRNCVNPATAKQLIQAFDAFEKNDDLWVGILHGKGGNFCAGYDLLDLSTMENRGAGAVPEVSADKGHGPMGPSRMVFSKPVLAAVTGYAVAGGLELSLMCDMRILEESAILGVFCRRFGVPLIDGGTVRLPQLIGLSRALDVILTGRPINAAEAKEFGIANRVVPTGSALGEAMKIAQSLCQYPQQCMRADRRSAYHSTYDAKSHKDAMDYEFENGIPIVAQESVKGAGRFVSGVGKSGSFDSFTTKDEKSKL